MHNILFYNSMKYIQNCMDCFHICMDCLYSLYELSPQNFCRGNPYNFFKLNISLILLIWRYSGICQSTVNTWSIVLYHRFILRLFCWILVNVFPLVVWIVPTLPYILKKVPHHFYFWGTKIIPSKKSLMSLKLYLSYYIEGHLLLK